MRPASHRRARPALPLGPFVGRSATLDAIDARLREGLRLITLVGAPGVGKTRLAQRVAEGALDDPQRWPGGVVVLELAQANDADDVAAALARALGPTHAEAADPARRLAGQGALLLVLDNFEQLGRDAAERLADWCRVAPEIHALVTSRVRLDVDGEVVVDVGPLSLPPRDAVSIDAVRRSEAVELFEARMLAARGRGFEASDSAATIATLVRELDGLPLALELAAARTRVLTPTELVARLDARFQLLSRRPRGPDDRHATLEAAIEASWVGLGAEESAALAECAVFAGSFSLDGAERVLSAGPRALELLASLTDRSLVIAEPMSGETRYRLLVSICDFAAARLAERGDAAEVSARHRAHYVDAARRHRERVSRSGDASARAWLDREAENLRLIVRSAGDVAANPTERAEAALALDGVSLARSSEERLRTLDRVIDAAAGVDRALLARLWVCRGRIAGMAGLADRAVADFARAVEAAEAVGARPVLAEALVQLSVRSRQRAELDEARALGERALREVAGTEHPRVEAEAWACLGLTYGELDRPDEARDADERALAMFRALGDVGSQGLALGNLAQLAQAAGELERADRLYDETLRAFRAVDDLAYEGVYLGFRAGLHHERGDLDRARELYGEAIERLDRARAQHVHGLMLGALGALEAAADRVEEAERCLARAERSEETAAVPAYRAALALFRGLLELAYARRAEAHGHAAAARAHRAEAVRRRAEAEHADISASVRAAVVLLDRALAVVSGAPVVRIASSGAWFELGEGARVDLERRGALRRVLAALVEARAQGGRAVSRDALIAAGWPGERVLAEAASTRVRVAIATLRRLGLSTVIVTREDGYALDPGAPLTVARA